MRAQMNSGTQERSPLNLFLFGGCDIYGPLDPLFRSGEKVRRAPYGHIPFTYTFGEIFQTIAVLRGEREVPDEIKPLCFMDSETVPVAQAAQFGDVDVFLVEPASPVDMTFRGCYLNRLPLSSIILQPLRQISKEASKYANLWLRFLLTAQDDQKRLEVAEELIKLMPADFENAEFTRSILTESYSRKIEVPPAFGRVQSLLGRPIGVVNYIFRYLEDGRAVSWPAGLQEEIQSTAKALQLPVFDPAPAVREFGVKAALLPELSHYSDEFNPIIGDKLADFAIAVSERSAAVPNAMRESRSLQELSIGDD
jgi:hypothetical protein